MTQFLRILPRAVVLALILAALAASAISVNGATGATPDAAASPAAKPRNLAIFVFEGVQIIDYTAPWEVFGHAHVNDHEPAFQIYTVAQKPGPITTAMGMSVNPKYTFANAPKVDVLVLPGGSVKRHMDDPQVKRWVQETTKNAEIVLSVCNGAFFLGRAGLLDGLEATTFAGLIDELQAIAPKARVVRDRRYVDNGKIITSAGLSSGIDGALHVIERLLGKGDAQVAATSLEYDWRPDGGYVRAMLADRYLDGAYEAVEQFERTVVSHEGTRDRWETRWIIRTNLSPREALDRFEKAIPAAPGWTRDAVVPGSGADSARTVWRYRDDKGQLWVATATFTPGDEKGKLLASAAVVRGGTVSSK